MRLTQSGQRLDGSLHVIVDVDVTATLRSLATAPPMLSALHHGVAALRRLAKGRLRNLNIMRMLLLKRNAIT